MQTMNDQPIMSEHDKIRALIHRYCDAVCTSNAEQWIDTWIHDGVWNIGRGDVVGREAILAAYQKAMSLFEHIFQLTHNGTASIDGDTATGSWYVTEHGRSLKGTPVLYIFHYDDEYRKTEDGWRFARRAITWHYLGKPDMTGMFGPPPGSGA